MKNFNNEEWSKITMEMLKTRIDYTLNKGLVKVPSYCIGALLTDFNDATQAFGLNWLKGGENSLLISSEGVGNGKTRLAAAILLKKATSSYEKYSIEDVDAMFTSDGKDGQWQAGRIMKKLIDTSVYEFTSLYDIAIQVKRSYTDNFLSEYDIINNVIKCNVLVLDDIGSEKPSVFTNDLLYRIVEGRLGLGNQTIFTTNLNSAELEKMYGTRVFSRMVGGEVVKLSGEDRRMKKMKVVVL